MMASGGSEEYIDLSIEQAGDRVVRWSEITNIGGMSKWSKV